MTEEAGAERPPTEELVPCTLEEGTPFLCIGDRDARSRASMKFAELSYAPEPGSDHVILAVVLAPEDRGATERAAWCVVVSNPDVLLDFLDAAGELGAVRYDLHALYDAALDPMGCGGFSTVHAAKRVCGGSGAADVAVKVIKPKNSAKEAIFREVESLLTVGSHPNTVAFRGLFRLTETPEVGPPSDHPEWALVTDLCEGDLYDLVVESFAIREDKMAAIFRGVLDALVHIHGAGIVHRDIKAENILLTGEARDHALLCDFGVAARVDDAVDMDRRCGSPGYAAPELLNREAYGTKVDLFSAGCLLYFGLTGMLPFGNGNDQPRTVRNTISGKFDESSLEHLTADARHLVHHLLQVDPADRLSGADACQHPWFNDGISSAAGQRTISFGHEAGQEDVVIRRRVLPYPEAKLVEVQSVIEERMAELERCTDLTAISGRNMSSKCPKGSPEAAAEQAAAELVQAAAEESHCAVRSAGQEDAVVRRRVLPYPEAKLVEARLVTEGNSFASGLALAMLSQGGAKLGQGSGLKAVRSLRDKRFPTI